MIRGLRRRPAPTVRHNRIVWQAAALLLAYPDEGHTERLDLVERSLGELPTPLADPLARAVAGLRALPTDAAATAYVETFDLRRRRALFLTYWTDGDTRNRGNAMLAFAEAYRLSGVEPPTDELPDHLAVVLEFAATVDDKAGLALLTRHRAPIELLRLALAEYDSPYAGVIEAVVATVPEGSSGQTRREALDLARQGPPVEQVGLEPYAVTIPTEQLTASLRGGRSGR